MGNNLKYCKECEKDLSKTVSDKTHKPCDMCDRLTCYKSGSSWTIKRWHCESCSFKWSQFKAVNDPTYAYR